jgi:NADPH:quinone reductase-like Zn-dependent oxidoreductase
MALKPPPLAVVVYSLGDKRPYLEDWAILFKLLEEGKIKPVIEKKFPILEAAQANVLLESGQVTGNVVLLAPSCYKAIRRNDGWN